MSIASEIERLQSAKANIKTSIESKGVTVPTEALISTYDTYIDQISGGGLDWSAIGYSQEPQSIIEGYNYAAEIKNNWTPATSLISKFEGNQDLMFMPLVDTSTATNMQSSFKSCSRLNSIPLLDTSEVTTFYNTFSGCTNLVKIPQLDTSKVTTMRYAFTGCTYLKYIPILNTSALNTNSSFQSTFNGCLHLTDTSLDNILQMCINATNYNGTKTLVQLGFVSANYQASRIEALPHYQAFVNAGWSIGY